MKSKIAVIVYPGLEYKKAILYASETAKDLEAAVQLIGVIPEFDNSERLGLAFTEYAPYGNISKKLEQETLSFFEIVYNFCVDNGLVPEKILKKGNIDEVIELLKENNEFKLVIVPTPTKSVNYSDTFGKVRKFAQNMIPEDKEARHCSVVAVL